MKEWKIVSNGACAVKGFELDKNNSISAKRW
jgi:hypothetical protein